ncbi:MAG: hypothetical protein ABFS02_03035 [Pseudomonadota bacterium]
MSKYHLSVHISYPHTDDRGRAERRGFSPRGEIMMHGRPNGRGWLYFRYSGRDWTKACLAVCNVAMGDILRALPDGTPITILP